MIAIPIRGRRENIKAELIEIANDPTVTGVVIGVVHGEHPDQKLHTYCLGKTATRSMIAYVAACMAHDAVTAED
jgi:hypothetical protein